MNERVARVRKTLLSLIAELNLYIYIYILCSFSVRPFIMLMIIHHLAIKINTLGEI